METNLSETVTYMPEDFYYIYTELDPTGDVWREHFIVEDTPINRDTYRRRKEVVIDSNKTVLEDLEDEFYDHVIFYNMDKNIFESPQGRPVWNIYDFVSAIQIQDYRKSGELHMTLFSWRYKKFIRLDYI